MRGATPSAGGIRVYVVDVDRLPRTILTSLLESRDEIEVIVDEEADEAGRRRRMAELIDRLRDRSPDVVIVGAGDPDRLEALVALLQTRVLVLADRGKRVYCSQLRPVSRVVGEITPDEFLSLIQEERLDRPRDSDVTGTKGGQASP